MVTDTCEMRKPTCRPRASIFFDENEPRSSGTEYGWSGGTHAVSAGSRTTLRTRLGQHRGAKGGRNPGRWESPWLIFRLHVGNALMARDWGGPELRAVWGVKQLAGYRAIPEEDHLERAVSAYIPALPVIWVPAPTTRRGRRASVL